MGARGDRGKNTCGRGRKPGVFPKGEKLPGESLKKGIFDCIPYGGREVRSPWLEERGRERFGKGSSDQKRPTKGRESVSFLDVVRCNKMGDKSPPLVEESLLSGGLGLLSVEGYEGEKESLNDWGALPVKEE